MCGIAGIVSTNANYFDDAVQNMVSALYHRGPDSKEIYVFENCILGHARLSIIDLETGSQPMQTADGKISITFNGEIYGYREIKKSINNYSFRTTSDTEVILALYKQQGNSLLSNLPGVFAFGIWDDQEQSLFCARDRFGEKPFYYALGRNGEFIFASEIKAIIASGLVVPILNVNALAHYLNRLYIHPSETIYDNIFTLPPAHYLIYSQGKIEIKKYWKLPAINKKININEAVPEFRKLFYSAVKKQLVADVPVAAFLSGGLDSASVVAAASETVPGISTFSFGFGDSVNELPYAAATAKKFSTNHTVLQSRDYDLVSLMFEMAKVYDEPFADSSNIPTYLISKETSKFCKVVLTGDGGDELLGGYDWYRLLLKQYGVAADISWIEYMLFRMQRRFYSLTKKSNKEDEYKKKISGFEKEKIKNRFFENHLNDNTYFNEDEISSLLGSKVNIRPSICDFEISGMLSDAMNLDLQNYMPGDILVKTDRASLANSLELRAPFLDVDLASFCISLPANIKVSGNESKVLLRRSMEHLWPEEIKNLPKQGFGAPVEQWLRTKEFVELSAVYLGDRSKKIYSVLDFETCRKYIQFNDYKKWILLVLSIWMETHSFCYEKIN
jgi:asparagine synthase (glutamine-hydrolysing)